MKPKVNKSVYFYIAAITAVNAFYFGYLRDHRNATKYVLHNGAKVLSCLPTDSTGHTFTLTYTFQLNDKSYTDTMLLDSQNIRYASHFAGRYFPVLYLNKNPSKHKLIIIPAQFKALNMSYPDSLKPFLEGIIQDTGG